MTKQRSFAGLTEEGINQIAEWLQHGTYDEVRDRVAKPRPEGFGLHLKSKRPLETLWKNKNIVDNINRKFVHGEKLTFGDLLEIGHLVISWSFVLGHLSFSLPFPLTTSNNQKVKGPLSHSAWSQYLRTGGMRRPSGTKGEERQC